MGFETIFDLAKYFFTLLAVLLFHGLVIYGLVLRTLTPLSPAVLRAKMRRVWAQTRRIFARSTAGESGVSVRNTKP